MANAYKVYISTKKLKYKFLLTNYTYKARDGNQEIREKSKKLDPEQFFY
jgi:hypothetical protein